MLEKIQDTKETEYQKLARTIGYEPAATASIFRELSNISYQRQHDFVNLLYHQLTYWHAIEFQNLPVLQTIVDSYDDLITKYSQNLDMLTYLFSGASRLLYTLYKHHTLDIEDTISVEPLDMKQLTQDDSQTSPAPGSSAKPHVLRSSDDFFSQLKAIIGKCFGLMLTLAASQLEPLLQDTILVDNFAAKKRNEIPSLQPIKGVLHELLATFQANLINHSLSVQFFSELFMCINNVLTNGILSRQQLCTEVFGSYLMTQIGVIQSYTDEMDQMWVGHVNNCFMGVKQVAVVLALPNKSSLSESSTRRTLCPSLNSLQIEQLLSMYTPGEFGERVPVSVINSILANAPTDSDRIMIEVNLVSPIPVKVLQQVDTQEDMLKAEVTPTISTFVESIMSGMMA